MKISIIGRGNVAGHLYNSLKNKGEVVVVNPHTLEGLQNDADVILISVADKAVGEVAQKIPETKAVVAHTAGSVPMQIFDHKFEHCGVFYPLQTFTKNVDLDYPEIPVFIEGNSPQTIETLKEVASYFTPKVYDADSEARKKLHLASVFACNFSNAMFGVAYEILQNAGLDFNVILPLLNQTLQKLNTLTPAQAQTGPALRGDSNVINNHLQMLSDKPELAELYKSVTSLIQNHASSKL